MKKTKVVTARMSENDYEKLKIISGDKGISECIRTLIDQAYRGVKKDIKVFQNFERMTEAMNQIIERLSARELIDKDGLELRHFEALMEVLKIMGNLIIALPDKRKIFADEVERIEAMLRGQILR